MTKEIPSFASATASISADTEGIFGGLRKRSPKPQLVEVRLEVVHLVIGEAAELERVRAKRGRVAGIEAASQSSSEDHASGGNTSNLEAAGPSRGEGELGATERFVAHVEVVLRNGIEGVGLTAFVNAAATDEASDDTAGELSSSAENTIAGKALAVERLLGFDRGGESHGESDDDGGELHCE